MTTFWSDLPNRVQTLLTHLCGEMSGRNSDLDLVTVHWWLPTVAIIANYAKVTDFHCGPYLWYNFTGREFV